MLNFAHLERLTWEKEQWFYVSPNKGDDWDVKRQGTQRSSSHFENKDEAVDFGRHLATQPDLGQLKIQKRDGTFQTEHIYGKDPHPPEGVNDMPSEQSFRTMLSNLNPTEKQRAAIQTTRDTIDQALGNDPNIHLFSSEQPSFLTGSYSRYTIIRPLDDIDLYVKIHYGMHAKDKSPRGILALMAKALRRRYIQTRIDVDSPCVVINSRITSSRWSPLSLTWITMSCLISRGPAAKSGSPATLMCRTSG